MTRSIELLAPARNSEVAIAAINHGADAVYMGAEGFGARSAACNSIADIAQVVAYAHQFGVKVYVTFNTLVYDHELRQAESMIRQLYLAGADALIVQDLGVLRLDIPPIELHASTQCDIRSPQKAAFLEALGFSQLVLARELSCGEIALIRQNTTARLEAFVHGALCVSYSGRCQASQALMRRSANRGECAQVCRLPFDLVDGQGRVVARNKHLLSLRDFNLSDRLADLLAAGVSSLKIEGRLKDATYVKNVVAYYRRQLDLLIAQNPGAYARTSFGTSQPSFSPDLAKSFNRRYTHYFFDGRQDGAKMAAIDTPKSMGEPAGKVARAAGRRLTVAPRLLLNNGDGISYFDRQGRYSGFRVNRVEGDVLLLPQPVNIAPGTPIFRTFDKKFEDEVSQSVTERKIAVDFTLRVDAADCVTLDAADERGCRVSCSATAQISAAQSPQAERQRAALAKTGGSIYICRQVATVGEMFVPQSVLATLRRQALQALDRAQRIAYRYGYRKKENLEAQCFAPALTSADNVANHLARSLYADHGVAKIEPAIEVQPEPRPGQTVMHTRYCIRRELGICLKTPAGRQVPQPLTLHHGNTRLQLNFDCSSCEMQVKTVE